LSPQRHLFTRFKALIAQNTPSLLFDKSASTVSFLSVWHNTKRRQGHCKYAINLIAHMIIIPQLLNYGSIYLIMSKTTATTNIICAI
jgi:hypothetical protein